jgi:hypothetical protein
MTSMIYCNTVSKSPKDSISIHVYTCISVEILCLFTKVLNFSNHMRLLPVLYPTHKKEWSSRPTVVTIILHKSSTRLWNKNTKEFISNTTIALSIDEYNLNSGNTIKTIIGGGPVNYSLFSLFSSNTKKKRILTEITLKDVFSYRL